MDILISKTGISTKMINDSSNHNNDDYRDDDNNSANDDFTIFQFYLF